MITKTANELVKEAFWGALGKGLLNKFVPKNAGLGGKILGYGGLGVTGVSGVSNIAGAANGGVQKAIAKSAYMPNSVATGKPFQQAFLGR